MLRHVVVGAAAAITAASAQAATATFLIDDFSVVQPAGGGYLVDTTRRAAACSSPQFGGSSANILTGAQAVDTGAVAGSFSRSMSISLCSGVAPFRAAIGANTEGSGVFEVINDPGERSVAALRYSLGTDQFADELAAFGPYDSISFVFSVVTSDDNPVDVTASLTGLPLGTAQIGSEFTGLFSVPLPVGALPNGNLTLIFLGAAGYDIAIDGLGLRVARSVASPASAALFAFGFGLSAAALRRRRPA